MFDTVCSSFKQATSNNTLLLLTWYVKHAVRQQDIWDVQQEHGQFAVVQVGCPSHCTDCLDPKTEAAVTPSSVVEPAYDVSELSFAVQGNQCLLQHSAVMEAC